MPKKKKQVGGAREGAGRPKIHADRVTVVVSMDAKQLSGIDQWCREKGWSRSRAVREAIREVLGDSGLA